MGRLLLTVLHYHVVPGGGQEGSALWQVRLEGHVGPGWELTRPEPVVLRADPKKQLASHRRTGLERSNDGRPLVLLNRPRVGRGSGSRHNRVASWLRCLCWPGRLECRRQGIDRRVHHAEAAEGAR